MKKKFVVLDAQKKLFLKGPYCLNKLNSSSDLAAQIKSFICRPLIL
jgi:hypothetical protein